MVVIDVFRTWHYLDHAPDTIGEGGVPSIPFYALCCRVGVALVGAIVPLVFRPLRRFFILAMLLIAIAAINSVISLLWQYS
ncbi:MAG: hypothetical protein IPK69_08905 [Phycisphaerales bacterium]|nr:MAG: hypothetical protein IPK69_08905 [Phycisphaerales bacterium]